jgi:outer membrane protein assembly factor BamB
MAIVLLAGLVPLGRVWAVDVEAAAPEQNWPQWRGPLGTGVAPAANPPITWSETENIRWKRKLPGSGTASPVIWDNQIFVQAAIPAGKTGDAAAKQVEPPPAPKNARPAGQPGQRRGGGMRSQRPTEPYQFVLLCLDRRTGETIWQKVAREELPHEGHHPDHGFSSYSPVTDGNYVFAYFGSRGLYCFDLDGNLKWQKDFGRMQTKNGFGEGSSPALFGNTLVINWDHEGADFIVAMDKATGNELWRQSRDEETSWATPLIVQHAGQAQVVTAATRKIRSYDLASGKLVWECAGLTPNTIPTPVAKEGMVYATSGFRGNALLAIRLGRAGDLTGTDAIAWRHDRNTPYVPSPLLYGDKLYFFAGNNNVLSCFNADSGTALIDRQRVDGLQGVYASPVGAGGRVYLVGRNGATVVLKHSDTFEVLATNQLDERIDASPAVAGNELFLRGHEHLYCVAEN